MNRIALALWVGWLVPALGFAQDGATAAPPTAAPPLRVVGFTASEDGQCGDDPAERISARDGECVDVVDFFDLDVAWRNARRRAPSAYERAVLRGTGELYGHALQDIVYRWGAGDITQTLITSGYSTLPSPADTWEASRRLQRSYSLPRRSIYLGPDDWTAVEGEPALFPAVRFSQPEGSDAPPPMVVLSGRFAVRLGADGKHHDFDLMAADPASSAPFFEQMFPYEPSVGADEGLGPYEVVERVPLAGFRGGSQSWEVEGDLEAFQGLVEEKFTEFRAVVLVQAAQFALSEFTHNHVRVVAAITAMARKPGEGDDGDYEGLARDLNAAARGETDSSGDMLIDESEAQLTSEPDAHLRVRALPEGVAKPFLAEIAAAHPPRGNFWTDLNEALAKRLAGKLRDPVVPLPDVSEGRIQGWLSDSLLSSEDPVAAALIIRQEAILLLLDQLSDDLDPEEWLVLAGLAHHLSRADDRYDRAERDWMISLAEAEVPFEPALLRARVGFFEPEPLLEAAAGIHRTEARVLLLSTLRSLAAVGGVEDEEQALLDALVSGWAESDEAPQLPEVHLGYGKRERHRYESRMLVEHARRDVSTAFDPGRVATPREVAEAAAEKWQAVLMEHGYDPAHVRQGGQGVDPLSVCTTLDGVDALDEPAVRPVELDLLVAAEPGLEGREVLWAARGELPFLLVDDPSLRTPDNPRIEPLVMLGDGRAVYRVRFVLWSGWHLFWSAIPDPETGETRLGLWTGAVCDDTVLVTPDLVPTLLRAALLSGNFRPASPEERGDARAAGERKPEEEPADADALLAQGAGAGAAAEGASAQATAGAEAVKDPDLAGMSSSQPTLGGGAEFEIVQEELRPDTRYLRDVMHAPIYELAGRHGLVLMVVDATAPGRPGAGEGWTLRTPYTRVRGKLRSSERLTEEPPPRDERRIRTAGWMWYFAGTRERPVQVSPSYTPRESVVTETGRPGWSRRWSTDYWVVGGAGYFPARWVDYACAEQGISTSVCKEGVTLSHGLSADLAMLTTFWLLDRPRLGLDVGAEARLDTVFPGQPPLRGGTLPGEYTWVLRPAGGLLLGLHAAPGPSPLRRLRPRATTWGVSRQNGSRRLCRSQWGVRLGILAGPGADGMELTFPVETWIGWSSRRRRSRQANLTPYHSPALWGFYARLNYGRLPKDGSQASLYLDNSYTLVFGLRGHLRLKQAAQAPSVK